KQEELCIFCLRPETDEVFGEMLSTSKFHVHYFCLLFSSGLHQEGDDKEPLRGFSEANVMAEHRRGAKLKCSYCKNRYATVGCCLKMCKKMFHVYCGVANQCLLQFHDEFRAYCPDHRLQQRMTPRENEDTCLICLSEFDPKPSPEVLVAPCCKHSFHKECLQTLALSAGIHHFDCCICKNKDAFQKEMQDHGIYIPENTVESIYYEPGNSLGYRELMFVVCFSLYSLYELRRGGATCYGNRKAPLRSSGRGEAYACGGLFGGPVDPVCGVLYSDCVHLKECMGELEELLLLGESKTSASTAAGEASNAAAETSRSSANQSEEAAGSAKEKRVQPSRKRKTAPSPEPRSSMRSRSRSVSSTSSFRESEPRDHTADSSKMLSQNSGGTRRPKRATKLKKRKVNRSAVASAKDEAQSVSSKSDVVEAGNNSSIIPANLRYEAANEPSASTSAGTSSLEDSEGQAMITCRNGKLCAMVKPRCSTDALARDAVETVTPVATTSGGSLGSSKEAARPVPTRMLQLLPPSSSATFRKPKPKQTPKKSSGVQLSLMSYLKQFMQHGSTSKD
ncbi:unnamed protein product, partial [Ixodes hexagonus]